jgi:hypothetical protein
MGLLGYDLDEPLDKVFRSLLTRTITLVCGW